MKDTSPLRILSLSCTYPNAAQPNLGVFVQERLRRLAGRAAVKIVAPVPWIEFGNPARRGLLRIDRLAGSRNGLDVFRPRWFYPPLGGALNAVFLFAQTLGLVRKIRRDFPFEILDAHFGYPDGITACLITRVLRSPYAITLRGNETMHARFFFRRLALRWAIRRADCVVTVSERLRDFAIQECGAPPGKVRTIPNGVDTSLFRPRDRQAARERFGIPPAAPLILSAGYLIERKGHHRVLQALHRLRRQGADVHLAIAGGPGAEGHFAPTLHRLVEELNLQDCVHFTGQLAPAGLAELMSAADVFCLASTREGWPNVVHESLACGTPAVSTDVGGVPDMLPSTAYGFVVPVNDQASLESALRRALSTQWDRAAIAAWGQSRSWEHVAEEVLHMLTYAARNRKESP
jgi:glycosyltransferase involved in cell wall biosynthesis